MNNRWKILAPGLVIAGLSGLFGCADTEVKGTISENNSNWNNNSFNNQNNQSPSDNNVVEEEEEFEFSAPAVAGNRIFVANETLNAVAVIDSQTLRISSVPVGFKPTLVVGSEANIFVLNAGASTVTRIDPETLKTTNFRVLRRANDLVVSPDGSTAFSWFNPNKPAAQIDGQVDLAAVSIITTDASYQLAVGFNVSEIRFSEDGQFALIMSDDGISRVRISDITADAIAPPVALSGTPVQDVLVDASGRWAVGRREGLAGLFLVNLESQERVEAILGESPSDLDWIDDNTLLAMFRDSGTASVISIPEGLQNLANQTPPVEMDMGVDSGTEDAGDMGEDVGEDVGADTGMMFTAVEGVQTIDLLFTGIGAAEVAPNGEIALLFTTLNDEKRAILLDIADLKQRPLAFEKGVRGAVADAFGRTFVVLHSRVNLPISPTRTPLDPEYIERSYAISLVDVASAANRLVLTTHYPDKATLWSDDGGLVKLFMTFQKDQEQELDTHRDLLIADLGSFKTSTIRLASLPEGLGSVVAPRQIFVSQQHPQGRITFIDVDDLSRQTVTGYQLNAGID